MKRIIAGIIGLLSLASIALANMPGTFNPILVAPAVVVPIGTPVSLGTVSNVSASVTSANITASTSVAVGDLVCAIFTNLNSTTFAFTTATDSLGNTYSLVSSVVKASSIYAGIGLWCALVTTGGTPTITVNVNTSTGGNGYGIAAWKVSGISTATADKLANYTTPRTTTPTSTTAALTQANEIAFGILYGGYSNCGTLADGSGFSSLIASFNAGYNVSPAIVSYKTVAATTAVTYASTTSTLCAQYSVQSVATFKGF